MDVEVLVRATEDDEAKGGWTTRATTQVADPGVLGRALESLVAAVQKLPELPSDTDWTIDELELSAELTAEGGVRIIGVATAGITGGVTIHLVRRGAGR